MKRTTAIGLVIILIFSMTGACLADFQYVENTKITGGAMAGTVKMLGVFSKDARKASHPRNTTISVKGGKMRREEDDGQTEIWDLDGRKIIRLDAQKKTYYTMTFDEMRAQIEDARKRAAEQQSKHKGKGQDSQLKMTPKIKITQGPGTKKLLGHTATEVKLRIDMEMESTDPKTKGQSGAMWTSSDQWHAPVAGYDEIKRFYVRLAKELEWLPGAALAGNMQIAPAMVEMQKSSAKLNGMPLLTNTSVGLSGNGGPGANSQAGESSNPLTKGIGGLFGKKKKKDDAQQSADDGSTSGSLMDMTVEVTSTSTTKLDAGLFGIPSGYKQVDQPKEKGRK
ncbi:MAG TPA: hypothetical protein VNW97_07485 [Candidatus Saccharimonadales bacterium]|jgi:hypothetical protein|nr:hypothetical protein [Candidatus Saccharimonadales bacterium]